MMTEAWKLKLALPAAAFALALAGTPVLAQDQDAEATQAQGQGTGEQSHAVGPDAMEEGSSASAHSLTRDYTDDDLRTRLESAGYMNMRDVVRNTDSISAVADRDGQMVHVFIIPMESTAAQ